MGLARPFRLDLREDLRQFLDALREAQPDIEHVGLLRDDGCGDPDHGDLYPAAVEDPVGVQHPFVLEHCR